MENNFNSNNKFLLSVPLVLVSKEPLLKIGKMNDSVNTERSILTKDPSSKSFKLVERKSNKEEARYTGTSMSEQASKYLIFQFNSDTGKIEVSPGGEWHFFKKELNYPTISIEEAENKTGLLDYIRNKNVITKTKKEKKTTAAASTFKKEDATTGKIPFGRLNDEDEDMEDEVRQFLGDKVEEQSEEERAEDLDPELKDIPSDIDEGFIKGKSSKENEEKEKNNIESVEDYSESDDELFGGDEDEEEAEDEVDIADIDEEAGFSDIDKEEDLTPEQENYISLNANRKNIGNAIANANTKDNDFIGVKRKGDDFSGMRADQKKQKTTYPLEDVLDNIFAKSKRITYEKLVKELIRSNFSKTEVDSHLPNLLSRMCDKYQQGGDFYYFKKSEKSVN